MFREFGMAFGGGFMWLLWVALIAVVIWGAWMVLGGASARGDGPRRRSARELLDDRYARGEIDDEEYQRRRDQLEQ